MSPRFTIGIEDMDDAEAPPLLDLLFDYQIAENNVYRHKWHLGDFVMWDNRSVMHARDGFDAGAPRLAHRLQFVGGTAT